MVTVGCVATGAIGQCPGGGGPCDEPNGTPGCDDVECCKLVCAIVPFCCDTEWDDNCADEAKWNCEWGACCFVDGSCIELIAFS